MKHIINIHDRFKNYLIAAAACLPLSATPHVATALSCPNDVIVMTAPNECSVQVFFDTLAFSHDLPLIDTVFLPESGSFFETGITDVLLVVTDINGDIEVCTFKVIVVGAASHNPVCLPAVSVSLQDSCERMLHPSEILDMTHNGCAGDFLTYRFDNNEDTIPAVLTAFDVLQTFTVVAVNQFTMESCSSQITISGGATPAITCPANITIHCNEPIDSSHTGGPALTGCYQNLEITYDDDITDTNCPDSIASQRMRTWTATDPYGFVTSCFQVITAMRYDANLVIFPEDFDGVANPVLQCSDTIPVQELIHPNLIGVPEFLGFPAQGPPSCKVAVNFDDFAVQICGAAQTVERVWKVVQVCPPSFTLLDTQIIVVQDTLAPQFIVPDTFFISTATECADTFYFPSVNVTHECSPFSVEIATPWDTLYTNGGLSHISPVPGTYTALYTLTDSCGNASWKTNTLLLSATILRGCPADTTVDCDYYLDSILPALQTFHYELLDGLGLPEFAINCAPAVDQVFDLDLNFCTTGTITRTFFTTNTDPPLSCMQPIHVVHHSDFEVIFPNDTAICDGNLASLPEPLVLNRTCEQTSNTFQNNIVSGELPGCYTVHRLWEVKNNCLFTGVNQQDDVQLSPKHFADGGDGIVAFTQIIEVNNQSTPQFPEGCDLPDRYLPPNSCSVPVTWPEPAVIACRDDYTLTISGFPGAASGGISLLPAGTYEVIYKTVDACGNQGQCSASFTVADSIAPVMACKPIVVELKANNIPPSVEVLAQNFDNGSTDNCTGSLLFSFGPDTSKVSKYYFCCQEGQYPMEIYAMDAAGNQSVCNTTLIVLTGSAACECGYIVAGTVRTEGNLNVRDAVVTLELIGGNITQRDTTGADGQYSFDNALPNGHYGVTPQKQGSFTNGVTTFDMVLIQRHILGVSLLNSPYKMIAADANASETITTFDLVQLRKLILNVITELPSNTSWRFVPADYQFPNPAAPFDPAFPKAIFIQSLSGDVFDADFIAIKVGDVNNSVNPQN